MLGGSHDILLPWYRPKCGIVVRRIVLSNSPCKLFYIEYKKNDVNAETPNVIQFRIKRLPFGLTRSPGILSTMIRHHVNLYAGQFPTYCRLDRLYCNHLELVGLFYSLISQV